MRKLIDILENRTAKHKALMVTGLYQAGKSRFVDPVSGGTAESVDISSYIREGWTDKEGNIVGDNVSERIAVLPLPDAGCLYLLEWQGARLIDKLVNTAGDFIRGWIIVLDATKPETFREAKSILETFRAYPELAAHVIGVNRFDDPDFGTTEKPHPALRLGEQIILMECDATNYQHTMDVVAALAERIPDTDFASLLRQHLTP
jgi:uncharacterized protein